MLEGKPARKEEAVTVDAIKSILADYEAEFDAAETERSPVTSQRQSDATDSNLQPVAVVETKVARPKFTTVPNTDQQNAMARTVASKMSRPEPTPNVQGHQTAASKQPGAVGKEQAPAARSRSLSLPKIAMPKLSLPKLFAKPRAAEQAPAQKVADRPDPMPMLRAATEQTEVSPVELGVSRLRGVMTRGRVALLALVVFVLLWPATFIFLAILSVFLVVGTFVFVGAERIWDMVARIAKWYTKRHPEKKDAVYDWLDDVAVRWDGCLDQFPEGSVDSLYMPDFSNIEEVERQHDAIVTDRLNRMQSQG